MRRFQVAKIPDLGEPEVLDESGSHHLLNVIRHERGDTLMVFDGAGLQAPAMLIDVRGERAVLQVTGATESSRPAVALHLVIGIPKRTAMEMAVRMATEAGVTDIHPVVAERSVARGDRGDRWRRIVGSAAQQCGRADMPTVHPASKLAAVLPMLPDDMRIGVAGASAAVRAEGAAAVLIGPEGGWTVGEIERATLAGAVPVGFGDWILRTETAAAVGIAAISRHNKADT